MLIFLKKYFLGIKNKQLIHGVISAEKSCKDGILLTVGFNRRIRQNDLPPKSRRDDTKSRFRSAVPAGLV